MIRLIPRAVAAALFGALSATVCLVLAYGANPDVRLSITSLPATVSGVYPAEREADRYFVWTTREAAVTLPELDRRSEWSCSVRFRGARGPELPQPTLVLAVDGVALASFVATNEFRDVSVTAPARPLKPGLLFTMTSSPTFVPGGADSRALGVQVDQLGCRPATAEVVLPPRRALRSAAAAAALLGAALGLTGITAGSAVLAAVLVGAAQSVPLAAGAGPYAGYPATTAIPLAAWMALLMVVAVKLVETLNGQPLRNTARFAVVFSAGAVYLKLLGLFHPSKALVDAVFHAHRFESVLAGHYYFTQLSTSATPFPYAIGLYVFAAPWSLLTQNHVALLRIVVCAADAIAGALLYLMVVRTRGDRLAGAAAVALFSFVPVSYAIIGNANLTNAFGAAVALATVAVVTIWPLQRHRLLHVACVGVLATLGFVSHVGTLLILLATLVVLALLYLVAGERALRPMARSVLAATTIAAVLSVVLFWGHFGDVYKAQLARANTTATRAATAGSNAGGPTTKDRGAPAQPALGHGTLPLPSRAAAALAQTALNVGWPILVLALVGAWRLWRAGGRDRLVLAVLAWMAVGAGFVAASVLVPGDARYQQDASEFIGRVEHMTQPAAVILAAVGAAWAWHAGRAARIAACILLLAAVVVGVHAWTIWVI